MMKLADTSKQTNTILSFFIDKEINGLGIHPVQVRWALPDTLLLYDPLYHRLTLSYAHKLCFSDQNLVQPIPYDMAHIGHFINYITIFSVKWFKKKPSLDSNCRNCSVNVPTLTERSAEPNVSGIYNLGR